MHEENEKTLIDHYLAGDEGAMDVLIQRYLKMVFGFVFRILKNTKDAEDVTQEVFIRVWKNIKKFDQARKFRTWVFGIARNAAIDSLRKKKDVLLSEFENDEGDNPVLDNLEDTALLPDQLLEGKDKARLVESILDQMKGIDGLIMILHYHDEQSFAEIAEILGLNENTVKSRHRRALVLARGILIQDNVKLDNM